MIKTMPTPNTIESLILEAGPSGEADFLADIRREARAEFAKMGGLPTHRDESWRYTNIAEIAETAFVPGIDDPRVTADIVDGFKIPDLDTARAVFVNGIFREDLSDLSGLGEGVRCMTLADAIREDPDAVHAAFNAVDTTSHDAFTAVNAAMMDTGIVLLIADHATMDRPVKVLSISTKSDTPTMTHARCIIFAGKGAKGTMLEHCVSLDDDAVYLNNAVTMIHAADDAEVEHYFLEREAETAYNVATLFITQHESSIVRSHTVLLGGKIVRNNVCPTLAGTKAHCLINGLYVGHHQQHLDNVMLVRHNAPDCESRQYYNGIMNDRSRGVFTGRIIVDKLGQQTDAVQSNKNMLLSDDARVNARPQLEIYADDVRCTHGATTGRVDADAVFYFRSRGLSEEVARAMLIYAFAAAGFDRMDLVPVRRFLAAEMIDKLPKAKGLSIEV